MPPTTEPTTVPPTNEPTTVPPTNEPTTVPPTGQPTTVPPTDTPTQVNECPYCTFTQGGYKNDCKQYNSWFGPPATCESLTLDWTHSSPGCVRDLCFFNTSFVLGNTSNGGFTATFTTKEAIKAFFPEGGPPAVFTGPSVVNPINTEAGTFGGQLLTAMMNVRFSANLSDISLLRFSSNCSNLSSLFYGKTILEVIYIANQVISGAAPPEYVVYTPGILTFALGLYNDNFDKCQNLHPECFECTPRTGVPTTITIGMLGRE